MNKVGVLWDLDGTLVDSEPVHEAAFHAAVTELNLQLPDSFHEQLLGASGLQVYEKVVAATGLGMSLESWRALKWEHFQQQANRITRIDGVLEILQLLQARDIPMAVVSNSTNNEVQLGLQSASLAHFMSAVITRDDVVNGKPVPDSYLLAAEKLGLQPAFCVVVEDSLVGVRAGLASGADVIYRPQADVDSSDVPEGARLLQPADGLKDAMLELLN